MSAEGWYGGHTQIHSTGEETEALRGCPELMGAEAGAWPILSPQVPGRQAEDGRTPSRLVVEGNWATEGSGLSVAWNLTLHSAKLATHKHLQ